MASGQRWPHGTLLAELAEPDAEALLRLGTPRGYGPGEVMLGEGATDHHVVVLLRGAVRVTGVSRSGSQTLLAIRVGGDIVGEQAAIDGEPRSATVTSVGETRGREIGRDTFVGFLHQHPGIAVALNRSTSAKLRRATRYRVDFGGSSVLMRLCRVLLELADTHGRLAADGIRIEAPLTQEDLAELASTTKASIERELRRLRDLGALRTGYRQLIVTDRQALVNLMMP